MSIHSQTYSFNIELPWSEASYEVVLTFELTPADPGHAPDLHGAGPPAEDAQISFTQIIWREITNDSTLLNSPFQPMPNELIKFFKLDNPSEELITLLIDQL